MACQTKVVKVLHESPSISSQTNLLPLLTQNIFQFFPLVKIKFHAIFCYCDTRENGKPKLNHVLSIIWYNNKVSRCRWIWFIWIKI